MKKNNTNPIGEGTVNASANLPKPLKAGMEKLAAQSRNAKGEPMSQGEFIRRLIEEAVNNQVVFEVNPTKRSLKDSDND